MCQHLPCVDGPRPRLAIVGRRVPYDWRGERTSTDHVDESERERSRVVCWESGTIENLWRYGKMG